MRCALLISLALLTGCPSNDGQREQTVFRQSTPESREVETRKIEREFGQTKGNILSSSTKETSPQVSFSLKNPLTLDVYRSDQCGCCHGWIAHLKENGFSVVEHVDNNGEMKNALHIPEKIRSCHTAVINGKYIEGHVPAADIQEFMENPLYRQAKGIAVAGMPIGSPGMEMGNKKDSYDVIIDKNGDLGVFSHHN